MSILRQIGSSLRRVMNPERVYYFAEDDHGHTTVDFPTQDEAYEAFLNDFGHQPDRIQKSWQVGVSPHHSQQWQVVWTRKRNPKGRAPNPDLDITQFVESVDLWELSHSQSEHGIGDAGKYTWNKALEASDDWMFVTDDNRDDIERWVREFGAWDREEIEGWSDKHLNALLLQFIAGDVREAQDPDFDPETAGGRAMQGDDGRWYYYVGI